MPSLIFVTDMISYHYHNQAKLEIRVALEMTIDSAALRNPLFWDTPVYLILCIEHDWVTFLELLISNKKKCLRVCFKSVLTVSVHVCATDTRHLQAAMMLSAYMWILLACVRVLTRSWCFYSVNLCAITLQTFWCISPPQRINRTVSRKWH